MVYNAGTAWLQVVPSFRGVRDAFGAEVKQMAAQADMALGKSFENVGDKLGHEVSRGMDEGLADAQKKGKDAGLRFSGAFATSMRRRLEAAWGSLPKVKIEADSSDVDREVQTVRKSLQKLKRDFGKQKLSPDDLIDGMRRLQGRIDEVKRNAENVELFRNAKVASGELASALAEAEEFIAQRFDANGRRSGDEFAGSFARSVRRNLEAAQHALPDIDLDADVSKVDRKLAKVKAEIAKLRNLHIKGDIDSAKLIADATALMARLEAIAKSANLSVEAHANIRSSQDGLRSVVAFSEGQRAEVERNATEAGARWGGAYGRAARQRIEAALQALPEVDVKLATTEIDKDIAKIRERLLALRDLHIRGEINSAQLIAEVKAIQAALGSVRGPVDLRTSLNLAGSHEALRQMLADFGLIEKEAKKAGEKAGREFSDKFSESLHTRLTAALKTLPEGRLGLDTSPAEGRINEIRRRIAGLAGKDIGIDVSTADALAEIRTLQEELGRLARDSPSVRIRTNAAAASAELVQVLLLANKIGSSDPRINVDVAGEQALRSMGEAANFTFSRLGFLIALGTSIGSVIVPAAGAAAAAIGGIATAAGAGVAGIGVLVLGLSGVGSAVQALNKYENDAQKSAASLTTSQNRLTGSLDSVENAERSLANTRASVAAAGRRAAQTVVDAQKSVVDAQREALRAQQDLNRAYEEARRRREDEALALRSNALAQRQAVLDVADAKKELDAVLSNPQATADDRERATIAYEERVLQLEDLSVKAKRLAADRAEADRKGIAGSDQVVAAQERIRSTSDAVARAQQRLADSITSQQEQQRQGAFQITQASQAVVAAQRQVENATVRAGVAGGAAMADLQWQMGQLSPAGQQFSRFLFSLKDQFMDLRNAAQAGLLPGLETAITMIMRYFPQIKTFVGDVASALGDMAVGAVAALSDPVWREFFDYMGHTTVPVLEGMAKVTLLVAKGIIGIFNALTGFNRPLGRGLLDMAEGFAKWGATLEHSAGFQHFFEFVMQTGPLVMDFFKELALAATNIVRAWAPVGVTVLKVLTGIASFIRSIPVGVLTVIVFELSLLTTFLIGAAAYSKISSIFSVLSADVGKFQQSWQRFSSFMRLTVVPNYVTDMATVGLATNTFQTRLAVGMQTATATAKTALVGLRAALLGPLGIGIALAVVTLGIGYFIEQSIEQKNRIDSLKGALMALGDAYRQTRNLGSESIKNVIAQNDNLSTLIRNTKLYGVTVSQVARASAGDRDAQREVLDALRARSKLLQDIATEEMRAGRANFPHTSQRYKDAVRDKAITDEQTKSLEGQFGQLADNAEINALLDEEQRKVADSAERHVGIINQDAMPAFEAQFNALMKIRDANATAAEKVDALREADQKLFTTKRDAIRADEEAALATQAWDTIVQQATQGQVNAGTALTLNTALSRDNLQAVVDNRRALEGRFTALNDQFFATVALTGEVDKASQAHEVEKQKLVDAAKAAGFDAAEIDKIGLAFGTIPTDPKVSVNVYGVADVMTQMQTIQIATWALEHGITDPKEAVQKWAEKEAQAQAALDESRARARRSGRPIPFAAGGFVSGPGGPTEDMIPAMLSNGEYVIPARTVRQLGIRWFDNLIGRNGPQARYPGDGSGGIALATGGPVARPSTQPGREARWPAAFDFRKYLMDVIVKRETQRLADRKAAADAAGGVVFFGPVTEKVGFAQQWLRQQAGKPYGWAQAGPASYDCSGIVSAVWNILHGRNPYQHTFSTSNQAPFFPQKGAGGVLTSGWSNPGEGGPGGGAGDVGHTAGVLAGLPFESRGGRGVVVGPGVTPVRGFAHIGHFDRGGYLDPGVTMVVNGTGRPEPVLTGRQWSDVSRLVQTKAGAPTGNSYNFEFRDTDLTVSKLRALQNADAVRARTGRPR